MVATAAAVAGDGLDGLELGLGLGLGLQLVGHGPDIVVQGSGSLGQGARLENATAVIAGTVVIEALADDLATLDDDAAVAVVKG